MIVPNQPISDQVLPIKRQIADKKVAPASA